MSPCVFLVNLPPQFTERLFKDAPNFDPWKVRVLKLRISFAANCDPEKVEIHISGKNFFLLNSDGKVDPHPVHGFVLWHGSNTRGATAKMAIATAITDFLRDHGLAKGFDLTFFDMPEASFFLESFGAIDMVPGGQKASKPGPDDGDLLG